MEPCKTSQPFCRVCMESSLPLVDFHLKLRDQNHIITISECFEFVTHIKLDLSDELQQLCTVCAVELKSAFHFIRKAEQAEKRLQEPIDNPIMDDTGKLPDHQVLYETVVEEIVYDNESLGDSNPTEEHGTEFETQSSCSLDAVYTEPQNVTQEVKDPPNDIEFTKSSYEAVEDYTTSEGEVEINDEMNTTKFHCQICKKKFKNHRSLYQHKNRFHQNKYMEALLDDGPNSNAMSEHNCPICLKTFKSSGLLKTHLRYHERKQLSMKSKACPVCGKSFVTEYYLRQHTELVHADERAQLSCDICDKKYISKNALENHKRIHTGQTVQCKECGKSFSNPYELKIHLRFHARDFPFECTICDKKFAIKGHLRTHMWQHEGLKLSCEDCGKLFTSTKALTEHSFSHAKEMPYPCKYCNKSYPSKQKYKAHLKMVHKIEYVETEHLKTNSTPELLIRRKNLPLVQADSVMKEIEIPCKESENSQESSVDVS